MRHSVLGIIPARYASTRLPGKPLLKIGEKTIIHHVYDRARAVLEEVVVATDDERIASEVASFGGQAVMTSDSLRSGTDRCAAALQILGSMPDIVINIQGDEPFVHPEHLQGLIATFDDPKTDIATTIVPFKADASYSDIANPNSVKVVIGTEGKALYFSRSVVPYLRGIDEQEWSHHHTFYKHQGLYAYRAALLPTLARLEPAPLEIAESLEQLRWLSQGYCIRTVRTHSDSIGIDTPDDLERARIHFQALASQGK